MTGSNVERIGHCRAGESIFPSRTADSVRSRSQPWRTRSSNGRVGALLNAIYEEDFLGFSYGFRPGRGAHDALDALCVGIHSKKVSYVLDADIRSFFDEISQEWLIRFLEHRIGDRRIIRLIRKWLRAGVLEDGVVTISDRGDGARIGDLTAACQHLPALCPRPLGRALATA